jgi:hypothetical protein
MNNSSISSAHHYYLVFTKPEVNYTLNEVYNEFCDKGFSELILKSPEAEIYHVQKRYNSKFGSSILLFSNKDIENPNLVWYDFYIGMLKHGSDQVYFICYPYKNIQKEVLKSNFLSNTLFYLPNVENVLNYFKHRSNQENLAPTDKEDDFISEIVKYTAELKDDANADRINIIGNNPLNSSIYKFIEANSSISIKHSSMKLKCIRLALGSIDLLFDRHGNFRFWIPKNTIEQTLVMISSVFTFFSEIDAFNLGRELSSYSTIDKE